MRIQGRLLRPATLAERRLLKSIGVDAIRVPRRYNPFAVARMVRRMSRPDVTTLKAMVPVPQAVELPDSTPEPREEDRAA